MVNAFVFHCFNCSNRGFAWRPCCMPGTIKMFCIRMNILSHRNNIELFLACNMAAMQNLYCQNYTEDQSVLSGLSKCILCNYHDGKTRKFNEFNCCYGNVFHTNSCFQCTPYQPLKDMHCYPARTLAECGYFTNRKCGEF